MTTPPPTQNRTMRRLSLAAAGVLIGLGLGWWYYARQVPGTGGAMGQQVYIWQRQWDDAVRDAITAHGSTFERLVVLAGEVEFRADGPTVVNVRIDHEALRQIDRPVGLAIRIGPYSGPFHSDDELAQLIADLSRRQVAAMRSAGIEPAELQLDFDAATRHLAGYRLWVQTVRDAVAPTPVTITALPSWMRSPDFGPLVRATDGYVLQVHALERPSHAHDPVPLVDPDQARKWVWQAARHDVPFQIALPTYGYLLAFDPQHRFIGLAAEGPVPDWPEGTLLRELEADAAAMAELVREWTAHRPMMMQGVIWYRLPTQRDVRNWRWPTLEAVMAGQVPQGRLTVRVTPSQVGQVDLELANIGSEDVTLSDAVIVRWRAEARLLAHDTLAGFQWRTVAPGHAQLVPPSTQPALRLRPGESKVIAWMRFTREAYDTEVHAHVALQD